MADLEPLDLAYVAGLIDGEGTIGITEVQPDGVRRHNPQHRVYLAVTMTDEWLIAWLHAEFGGYFQALEPRGENHKPTYRWSLQGKAAAEFCKMIAPYLRLKHPQAKLVVRFFEQRKKAKCHGLPADELAERRKLKNEIQALNHRGSSAS